MYYILGKMNIEVKGIVEKEFFTFYVVRFKLMVVASMACNTRGNQGKLLILINVVVFTI